MSKRKSNGAGQSGGGQFPIPAPLVEHILLGPADDRRVLQDSPVLADVWLAYAADPASIQDLLITPHMEATSAEVASEISARLRRIGRSKDRDPRAKIAYLQGIVAAQLYFDEVLRILVPLTQWWTTQGETTDRLARDPDVIRSRIEKLLNPASFIDARALVTGCVPPDIPLS